MKNIKQTICCRRPDDRSDIGRNGQVRGDVCRSCFRHRKLRKRTSSRRRSPVAPETGSGRGTEISGEERAQDETEKEASQPVAQELTATVWSPDNTYNEAQYIKK